MDDSVEVCVEVEGKIETECIFVDDVNINFANLTDLILNDGLYIPSEYCFLSRLGNHLTIKQEERITVKSFGNIINGRKIKLRCIIEDKKSVEPPLKKKKLKIM